MLSSKSDENTIASIKLDADLKERTRRASERDIIKIAVWLTACAAGLIAIYMVLIIAP